MDRGDVEIGDQELRVLVADEPADRRQGLMEIERLPSGIDGMLFVFEEPPLLIPFHMRNTMMDLDIWWFDADGVLLGMTEMEPCLVERCPLYWSPAPILWALEVPAGTFRFEPGDVLSTMETG